MEQKLLQAFDELADALFRHCYYRIHDREKAKDMVQETFTKTWEYISSGREISNLKAFLYKVATNLLIDSSRRKEAYSLEILREQGFDPAGQDLRDSHNNLDAKNMVRFLKSLDEKYRVPVMMRYLDDLSPKEIAEILQETENTVSVRIHRGLQQIRKILEKQAW